MGDRGIGGKVAIVSVGASAFTMKPVKSNEGLAADSLKEALRSIGKTKEIIDGIIVTTGFPLGLDYDRIAKAFRLDVKFTFQTWAHGRFTNPAIQLAAMAIHTGMAETILCISVCAFAKRKERGGAIGGKESAEEKRIEGGAHGEQPLYGLAAPMGGAAVAMQKYLSRYGYSGEEMAALVLTQRENALLNPHAAMRKPLTREEYLNSPYVIEPLRKYDCSLPTDGAVSVILTSSERARDLCETPIYLTGMQPHHAGQNEHSFALPGLGIFIQDEFTYKPDNKAIEMAGISNKNLNGVQIYDAFVPQTIATIERFGFCEPGECLAWIQNGRIGIHGELPVNTSGGFLSEAHMVGWNDIAEIVHQLRHEAGARQVPNAQHMMYAHSSGDATVFSREVS
jgi:acetyl-CoA acetyltransferase